MVVWKGKLWKAKFFIPCDVILLVRLQGKFDIDHSYEWKGKEWLAVPHSAVERSVLCDNTYWFLSSAAGRHGVLAVDPTHESCRKSDLYWRQRCNETVQWSDLNEKSLRQLGRVRKFPCITISSGCLGPDDLKFSQTAAFMSTCFPCLGKMYWPWKWVTLPLFAPASLPLSWTLSLPSWKNSFSQPSQREMCWWSSENW